MATYNERKTDYRKAHGFNDGTLDRLAASLDLFEGARVLDLMSGQGVVSQAVVNHYGRKGIKVYPTLHEGYREQLPPNPEYPVIISDARQIPAENESFDGLAVKMGIHEIPKCDQPLVFAEAARLLRPGRVFSLWELALEDEAVQRVYQNIIRRKDELAGFYDLANNRHFMREEQIFGFLKGAGFVDVEVYAPGTFFFNSANWLGNDLANDQNKLKELNEFVRQEVSPDMRLRLNYQDNGDSISMKFNHPVIRARKGEYRNPYLK